MNIIQKQINSNKINSSLEKEFAGGEYVKDNGSTLINIYQFENEDKLVRLLEHELGHAIGLDHLENPNDIMYKINGGGTICLQLEKISRQLKLFVKSNNSLSS
jgi:predicted Zn-dependent protease